MAKVRKRLGEMLVEAGLVTDEVMQECLIEQKETKMKLGKILVSRGLLKEDDILSTVSQQLRVRRFNREELPPDPEMRALVPEPFARNHSLVPLLKRGSLIWVAMLDPTDITAIDAIVRQTKFDVEPVICDEKELNYLAMTVYNREFDDPGENVLADLEEVDVDAQVDTEEESAGPLNIDSLQSMAEEAPVVKFVNSILIQALNKGASDVHILPGQDKISLKFRVDGDLKEIPAPPKRIFLPIVSRIKLLSNMDISVTRIPQDGRFTYCAKNREISVRSSSLPTIYGEKIVMRLHVQKRKSMALDDMDIGDKERLKIEKAIMKPYGMILATGPTGSGKTTLLYAILQEVSDPKINIVTLEDPVEQRLSGVTQVQLNAKAGMTFASGLRSILRQDPDVIMVGEIRDKETADIGIQASMTGHKVLSTLHTNDSAGAVTRFIEMGIEPFLISSTIQVVIAQRLLRKVCTECIEPYEAPAVALKAMGVEATTKMHFFRGKGCPACDNQGFKGRLAVYEILEVDNQVQEMVLKRASSYEIKKALIRANKLRTLKNYAAYKVFEGHTTFEEYVSVAF
ncbi:MAG: general secretion pathway protein GspE [Desulfovibrio sp.]|nr:MAG: general secretion pathway protein GspE [Desulfovibrio sp.]